MLSYFKGKLTALSSALFTISAVLFTSCSSGGYSGKTESITIGTIAWEPSALIYIAENRGYFKANGLNVTVKSYDTGLSATQAMISGEIDIAMCAEYIIAQRAFDGEKICCLATIARSENEFIIGRIDRGILNHTDFKGKIIGLPRHTVAEFYLGRFLELHGMSIGDVTVVDILPQQLGDSLAGGAVDAVVAWQPYADNIKKRLGDSMVSSPVQSGQLMFWNMVCTDSLLGTNPKLANRVMDSLTQAEGYLVKYPNESKLIVNKYLNYSDTYINEVWPEHDFTLILNQSLITAMEDEARWIMSNNLTAEKTMPDFSDYIHENALKTIMPEAVNIIR